MKKIAITLAAIAFIGLPGFLWAQEDEAQQKGKDKETQEVIIRKNGDKQVNLTVEIDGEKVLINGKPLSEFKDDQITINKRKMIIKNGDKTMAFDFDNDDNINLDSDMMGECLNGKETSRPFLGVTTEKTDGGVKIMEIVKESGAEKAGLKEDDIITKIDNEKIADPQSLFDLVSSKKPGDVIKVYYKRGNSKEKSVKATLGEKKMKKAMAFSFSGPDGNIKTFKMPDMKMFSTPLPQVPGLNDDDLPLGNFLPRQKKLGLKIQDTEEGGNVKVIDVEPASAAEKAGLKKDDIITEIGGQKINNTDDAREQLKPEEGKNTYSIKVMRNGTAMDFEVKIPKKLKTADL